MERHKMNRHASCCGDGGRGSQVLGGGTGGVKGRRMGFLWRHKCHVEVKTLLSWSQVYVTMGTCRKY